MTAIDGLLARMAAAMSVEVRPWAERVTAPPAVTSNAKVTRDRSRPTPPRLSRLFLSLASVFTGGVESFGVFPRG